MCIVFPNSGVDRAFMPTVDPFNTAKLYSRGRESVFNTQKGTADFYACLLPTLDTFQNMACPSPSGSDSDGEGSESNRYACVF